MAIQYITTTTDNTAGTSTWTGYTTAGTNTWVDNTTADTPSVGDNHILSDYVLTPLTVPTIEEFDSDYDKDTQETEDLLKIMKRLARGCYKGNSCKECNNKRIKKEYKEKYGYIPLGFTSGDFDVTYNISPIKMTWRYDEA